MNVSEQDGVLARVADASGTSRVYVNHDDRGAGGQVTQSGSVAFGVLQHVRLTRGRGGGGSSHQ
jgi:hypothetical protein